MASFVKNLHYADDIMDLYQLPLDLKKEVSRGELKRNINKTKVLSLIHYGSFYIYINGQNIEGVGNCVGLGIVMSTNSNAKLVVT